MNHPQEFCEEDYPYALTHAITYCLENIARQLPHLLAQRHLEQILTEGLPAFLLSEPARAGTTIQFEILARNQHEISQKIAAALFTHGIFTYPLFRLGALHEPRLQAIMPYMDTPRIWGGWWVNQAMDAQLVSYTLRLHQECAKDFQPEYARALAHCACYRGVFFLLMACQHSERLKVKRLAPTEKRKRGSGAGPPGAYCRFPARR